MLINQLKKNNTILGRYKLYATKSGHTCVDTNRNGKVDLGQNKKILEPMLEINLPALADFRDLNRADGTTENTLYTKECLGDVEHFSGRWVTGNGGGEIADRENEGQLSGLAETLNPLKGRVVDNGVKWALEVSDKDQGYLYLYTDKIGGGC